MPGDPRGSCRMKTLRLERPKRKREGKERSDRMEASKVLRKERCACLARSLSLARSSEFCSRVKGARVVRCYAQ